LKEALVAHAARPEELHSLWQQFARAKDAAALASLYEDGALVIAPDGRELLGVREILAFYREFVAADVSLNDLEQRAALVNGDLAITSMRLGDGVLTCEVARRQPDGRWLWVIDKPRFSSADK
jgi:ketosteroid isomerase-like protein